MSNAHSLSFSIVLLLQIDTRAELSVQVRFVRLHILFELLQTILLLLHLLLLLLDHFFDVVVGLVLIHGDETLTQKKFDFIAHRLFNLESRITQIIQLVLDLLDFLPQLGSLQVCPRKSINLLLIHSLNLGVLLLEFDALSHGAYRRGHFFN